MTGEVTEQQALCEDDICVDEFGFEKASAGAAE